MVYVLLMASDGSSINVDRGTKTFTDENICDNFCKELREYGFAVRKKINRDKKTVPGRVLYSYRVNWWRNKGGQYS